MEQLIFLKFKKLLIGTKYDLDTEHTQPDHRHETELATYRKHNTKLANLIRFNWWVRWEEHCVAYHIKCEVAQAQNGHNGWAWHHLRGFSLFPDYESRHCAYWD